MHTLIYKIKVLTNLHAGSGDAGFGIVDKLVQRDAATSLPCIYASGLKGALKEYFKNEGKSWISDVFGDMEEEDKKGGTKPGAFRFLSADLLAIPVPQDESPYYKLAFDDTYINNLQQKYKLLKDNFSITTNGYTTGTAAAFETACRELPVIARNHLENGQSKNLWYEEVVPHKTEFITAFQYSKDPSDSNFNKSLDGAVVQVGGNATVGYGLCLFENLKN